MPIEVQDAFEGRRLGISFMRFGEFSIGKDLARLIDTVEKESKKKPRGRGKRIMRPAEHVKGRKEVHLSAIVEVPIVLKELILREGEAKVRTRTEYYPRNVEMILRLDKKYAISLAQSTREVKECADYLRDLTLMNLNLCGVKLSQEAMQKVVGRFESISRLKVAMKPENPLRFVRLGGTNLLDSPTVRHLLSDTESEIVDVGGIWPLSPESMMKVYLNNRGRAWIYANPAEVVLDDIFDIARGLESDFSSPREVPNIAQRRVAQ